MTWVECARAASERRRSSSVSDCCWSPGRRSWRCAPTQTAIAVARVSGTEPRRPREGHVGQTQDLRGASRTPLEIACSSRLLLARSVCRSRLASSVLVGLPSWLSRTGRAERPYAVLVHPAAATTHASMTTCAVPGARHDRRAPRHGGRKPTAPRELGGRFPRSSGARRAVRRSPTRQGEKRRRP